MSAITWKILVNGEEWKKCHIERLEYERNLHILHQLKDHGAQVTNNGAILSDDEIDCLTAQEAWAVSIETRTRYNGEKLLAFYQDSLKTSDAMWHKLAFSTDKPMQVSRCFMEVDGISLDTYLEMIASLQTNEYNTLASHPEHFSCMIKMSDERLCGMEPFGMYGLPTMCEVRFRDVRELGAQIQADNDPEYPVDMAGAAYLIDGTPINIPYHQFKSTETGFAVKMAVYWPEHTPDEIVEGHSLHLAMEFYEGIKLAENYTLLNSSEALSKTEEEDAPLAHRKTFTMANTIEEILNDPEGMRVARKHLGKLLDRPALQSFKSKTAAEMMELIPLPPVKKKLKAMMDELSQQ